MNALDNFELVVILFIGEHQYHSSLICKMRGLDSDISQDSSQLADFKLCINSPYNEVSSVWFIL